MLPDLPKDIQMYILEFIIPMPMKLRSWIDLKKIDWYYLSRNPAAIELLRENLENINWWVFSENPAMFEPDLKLFNLHKRSILKSIC